MEYSEKEIAEVFDSAPLGEDAERIIDAILEDQVHEIAEVAYWGTDPKDASERNIPATPEGVAREAIEAIETSLPDQNLAGMRDLIVAAHEIARAANLDRVEEIPLEDLPSDEIPSWIDTDRYHIWSIQGSHALMGDCVDNLQIVQIWVRYNDTAHVVEDYNILISDEKDDILLDLQHDEDTEGHWHEEFFLCNSQGDVIVIAPLQHIKE